MRSRLAALVAAAALSTGLMACGGGGDEKDEPTAEDRPSQSAREDTRNAQSDRTARTRYEEAIAGYNRGYDRFFSELKKSGGDLDRLKGTISEYRDVIYEFDADIRAIEFRDELVPQVNAILENNRNLIARLDEIGESSSFGEAQKLYEEFLKDRTPQVKAVNRLLEQLGGGKRESGS